MTPAPDRLDAVLRAAWLRRLTADRGTLECEGAARLFRLLLGAAHPAPSSGAEAPTVPEATAPDAPPASRG